MKALIAILILVASVVAFAETSDPKMQQAFEKAQAAMADPAKAAVIKKAMESAQADPAAFLQSLPDAQRRQVEEIVKKIQANPKPAQ